MAADVGRLLSPSPFGWQVNNAGVVGLEYGQDQLGVSEEKVRLTHLLQLLDSTGCSLAKLNRLIFFPLLTAATAQRHGYERADCIGAEVLPGDLRFWKAVPADKLSRDEAGHRSSASSAASLRGWKNRQRLLGVRTAKGRYLFKFLGNLLQFR